MSRFNFFGFLIVLIIQHECYSQSFTSHCCAEESRLGSGIADYNTWFYSTTQYLSPSSGDRVKIFKLSDGGNTKQEIWSEVGAYSFQNLQFFNQDSGYFAIWDGWWSASSMIYKTKNSGTTLELLWFDMPLSSINFHFLNFDFGYAIAYNYYGDSSVFFQIRNDSMILHYSPKNFNFTNNQLHFINDSTGFIACKDSTVYQYSFDNNVLLRTEDSGKSWNTVLKQDTNYINSIYFNENNEGFLCCDNGILLKSIDRGETWQELNSGISQDIQDIIFRNPNQAFLVSDDIIYKSEDGGNTWSVYFQQTGTNLYSIKIFNDSLILLTSAFSILRGNLNEIERISENELISIYPNPIPSEFTIKYEIKDVSDINIFIYDWFGREVYYYELNNVSPGFYTNSFTDIFIGKQNGIYFMRMMLGSELIIKKIIKAN